MHWFNIQDKVVSEPTTPIYQASSFRWENIVENLTVVVLNKYRTGTTLAQWNSRFERNSINTKYVKIFQKTFLLCDMKILDYT